MSRHQDDKGFEVIDRSTPQQESVQEDPFAEKEDFVIEYRGRDLSDDPMIVADDSFKGRRQRKKEEQERLETVRREQEKAQLREEILAELREEIKASGQQQDEGAPWDEDEAQAAGPGSAEVPKPRKRSRFAESLMAVLSGNILSKTEVKKIYPYLLFISFLAFLYIGNVFRMQQLHRRYDKLSIEVKELRAKSMTMASQKMTATRQSNIIKEIERRGLPLKESLSPNKVIKK